jgi:hypothetical protein
MRDFLGPILFLVFFGSCASLAIMEDNDRQRCTPVCLPHAYAKVTAKGECVCNLNQIVKGE